MYTVQRDIYLNNNCHIFLESLVMFSNVTTACQNCCLMYFTLWSLYSLLSPHRAMQFIIVFLEEVLKGEPDLVKCAKKAYEGSLKKFHGWIVQGIFSVSSASCSPPSPILSGCSQLTYRLVRICSPDSWVERAPRTQRMNTVSDSA